MRPGFSCDLESPAVPLIHFWEHTVGSGHASLALRADWQAQLARCHEELGVRYVRFHGLLSDPMGTLVCEQNRLVHSFFNADQIFDFLLAHGMRPFVELSFMPETLASGTKSVFSYRGNVTPPKDCNQWGTLVGSLAAHWLERYGARELGEWFFEVWNEPNLKSFWTGTRDDYFELYRTTARALKEVEPSLRVGGPATAQNAWIEEFLDFCQREDVPADFVSTHYYPTDAFGKPGADTLTQLQHAPRDVLRTKAEEARANAGRRPLYYTEWNASSNPRDPLHDEPYTAAFATRTLMRNNGLVDGYSFWTFSDIFAENYFPSVPFHGGFGMLNLHGIAKPVYRAYELLHRLGTELLPVEGRHATVDVWVVRAGDSLTVLLTNHALPRHPIRTELVTVALRGTGPPRAAYLERIDRDHAHPRREWKEMGEPTYLSGLEVERLHAASRVVKEPVACRSTDGAIVLDLDLQPHAVAAVTIELDGASKPAGVSTRGGRPARRRSSKP